MEYRGQTLSDAFKIFDKAIEIAETNNKLACDDFLKCYAEHIYNNINENQNIKSLSEAYDLAKVNLGYIAQYHHISKRQLIEKYYGAKCPVYIRNKR